MVDGDQTEVGPKGVTLSGGQRWRVALARALYSRAGTIILDDVLSAVDAHVGRLIVNEALTGDLARGRTVILATHHAELVLHRASYHVHLDDGALESALHLTPPTKPTSGDAAAAEVENGETNDDADSSPESSGEQPLARATKTSSSKEDEEQREVGRVKWAVYYEYFKASGGALYWSVGVVVMLATQCLTVARTWSLKELSQQAASSSSSEEPRVSVYLSNQQIFLSNHGPARTSRESDRGVTFWLTMYVALYFAMNVVQVFRVLGYFLVSLKASRVLFKRMTHAILRAPLRWIDTVPAGRILNRFTTDTFVVDRRLSTESFLFLRNILGLIVIIGTRYGDKATDLLV